MIRIDRAKVQEPRALKPLRDAGLKHAREFFIDTPVARRRQLRYFNPYWDKAYRVPIPALVRLFCGKCAFCESKVNAEVAGVVDHLRPKWATRGLGREYAPDHYWWLAYAWNNLYLTCPDCNKHRGPRFPVKGKRINGPGEDPNDEEPLLLDPCSDEPGKHLRFDQSGRVRALSNRGDVTINLVALNRSDLIRRRRRVIKTVNDVWRRVLLMSPRVRSEAVAHLNELTATTAEFSGCASQTVSSHLARADFKTANALSNLVVAKVSMHERKPVVRSSASQLTPRFIDEIRLENFRAIGKLSVYTPSSDQSNQDWLMLIGENATGKSSILQAIALNLMSDGDRRKLKLDPKRFIKRGTSRATIEIQFRSDESPRRLTITKRRGFRCSDTKAGAPLMAYGATRLPPLSGMPARRMPLENLFNPFAPLLDPVAWLVKLATGKTKRRADFDYAARALAALLPGKPKQWHFRAAQKDILVDPEGPLRQLSDGYQSVIALACDIMATVYHSFHGGMEAAEGIVLIDELGAQLHPQWKMRLTKVLRQAFPRLQCIATTHDPLCLRGLRNGEVVTIEKTSRGRVFTRTDLPPIEGMQVDQILQSEYFGLRSAMDPDIEAQFERMYRLKAKPPKILTSRQRKELAQLEKHLARYDVLGSTRAERLMLSEITRFLARERGQPDKPTRDREWAAAQAQIARRIHKPLGVTA
jgi:uncharacterized protein (TIGR02646 family)